MSHIKIDSSLLDKQIAEMRIIEKSLEQISGHISRTRSGLNWQIAGSSQIRLKIDNSSKIVSNYSRTVNAYHQMLQSASSKYQRTEKSARNGTFSTKVGTKGTHRAGKGKTKSNPWWNQIKIQASLPISIKVGAGPVFKGISKVVSGAIDSYKKKGIVYRGVKIGVAVAASIGAVAGAAAAWGMTAGTAGVGFVPACIVTAHAANTVANSFSDIYNCIFGDVEQVGEVNCLKTLEQYAFGDKAGEVIYNTGSMISAVASLDALRGQIIQAPDMGKAIQGAGSELSVAGQGIVGLAGDVLSGKMHLGEVGYQIHLLSKEVKNITDLTKCVGILADVGKKTKDIAGTVAKTITGDCNSSIVDLVFGKDSTASTLYDIYKDGKDIFGAKSDSSGLNKIRDTEIWNNGKLVGS